MEVLGSIYVEVSDRFQKGIIGGGISRCVKAEKHDLGVVFMEQIILDGSQRGLENGKWRTYTDIMPSITAREYKEPRSVMEVVQIGNIAEEKNFRNPQTGRIYDVRGCSPTLSTMQGGNQEPKILESQIVAMRGRNPDNPSDRTVYRIRKLTPRECGRLMGVSDEDIDKMAAVNSNTQLYKQFGNSIVVDVMCAMFKNLNINQGDTV